MKCPNCGHEWEKRAPAASRDLDQPLPRPKKGCFAASFTVHWTDGSSTFVSGVPFSRTSDRWAAAFQAADRLRRLRASHKWEERRLPGAETDGCCGVRQNSYAWNAYIKAREMPGLDRIEAENETWVPPSPIYGSGDPGEAARLVEAMQC